MSQIDSDGIVRELLQTDRKKGLSVLFEQHYSMMCQTAHRIVQQQEAAEDIVQEIFIRLFEDSASLEKVNSFGGYLRRTAANRAIDHYRKASRARNVDLDQLFDLSTSEQTDMPLQTSETAEAIRQALERLPQQCRVVFTLKRQEGYTNAEVAEELGISVKTVENQMTKALKRLREMLGPLLFWILLLSS